MKNCVTVDTITLLSEDRYRPDANMRNRDFVTEKLSDVKNVDEMPMFPGQYAPLDLALFYPGGMP